jgi:hypothetical protein
MRKEGRDCDCDKRFRKYLLSSVIHIFRNGQSSHGRGDKCFEVTTSTERYILHKQVLLDYYSWLRRGMLCRLLMLAIFNVVNTLVLYSPCNLRGRRCHDRMVFAFKTTYICNQCLSPLKLWVRILLMARCTRYNIML